MENRQNTYGQPQIPEQGMIPPQGPMMPPMPPRPRTWRKKEVMMMGKRLFSNWLSLYPMVAYVTGNVDAGDKCGDKSRKSGDKSYD